MNYFFEKVFEKNSKKNFTKNLEINLKILIFTSRKINYKKQQLKTNKIMANLEVGNESEMNIVYKYRSSNGIVEYKIIKGQFGIDDTLHLQDTTCTHCAPKCEIVVVRIGDRYHYLRPLNKSAEEYYYFHTDECFWATKKEAYIEHLHIEIDSFRQTIVDNQKTITKASEKLVGLEEKEVNYLTSFTTKVGMLCYAKDAGYCRIIGTISFEDGSTGFLTDSNYDYGDRIILVKGKDDRIITENGLEVFLSKTDYDNLKTNNLIKKLINEIEKCNENVNRSLEIINAFKYIIDNKDTLILEQIIEMVNNTHSKK